MRIFVPTVFSCVASRNKRGEWRVPGYRLSNSGALNSVANHGFNWSSTSFEEGSLDMLFRAQGLNPGNADTRAHGFQLRCLSE